MKRIMRNKKLKQNVFFGPPTKIPKPKLPKKRIVWNWGHNVVWSKSNYNK